MTVVVMLMIVVVVMVLVTTMIRVYSVKSNPLKSSGNYAYHQMCFVPTQCGSCHSLSKHPLFLYAALIG
jgi:hypothetical protein